MFSPYLVTAALPHAVRGDEIYPDSPIHDGPLVITHIKYLKLLWSYRNEKSKNHESLVQINELETENKIQKTTIEDLQEELARYKSFD